MGATRHSDSICNPLNPARIVQIPQLFAPPPRGGKETILPRFPSFVRRACDLQKPADNEVAETTAGQDFSNVTQLARW